MSSAGRPVGRPRPPRVYSTDPRARPAASAPRPPVSLPPAQQTAYIRRETKGRGGKTVTVVFNLQLSPADLKALGKSLKAACGSGGTTKDDSIEIQGDHRDAVAAKLQALGYKTKLAGG